MVKVMRCNCKSEFQDETYGKGMRVFNVRMANNKENGYRCTVCGKETK